MFSNKCQLVYVNYGMVEDFAELEMLNVTVAGKICIVRYGKIFRGNKLHNCQTLGGIGLILFSDPQEVAPQVTFSSVH
jgi:energy-converting hydrogenase Eha subunit C